MANGKLFAVKEHLQKKNSWFSFHFFKTDPESKLNWSSLPIRADVNRNG